MSGPVCPGDRDDTAIFEQDMVRGFQGVPLDLCLRPVENWAKSPSTASPLRRRLLRQGRVWRPCSRASTYLKESFCSEFSALVV